MTITTAKTNAPHVFYIMRVGSHAGRPSKEPTPNCFGIICNNEDEKKHLYWHSWRLYQIGHFKHLQRGSVIPFLYKKSVKQALSLCRTFNAETLEMLSKLVAAEEKRYLLAKKCLAQAIERPENTQAIIQQYIAIHKTVVSLYKNL